MRLIDADALNEAMYHEAFETDTEEQKWDGGCWIRYKMFENKINEAQTIEERKTGRWEFVSYGDGLGNYHCSECRAIASSYFVGNLVNRHWEYKLTKYCPKCGAKMERSRRNE